MSSSGDSNEIQASRPDSNLSKRQGFELLSIASRTRANALEGVWRGWLLVVGRTAEPGLDLCRIGLRVLIVVAQIGSEEVSEGTDRYPCASALFSVSVGIPPRIFTMRESFQVASGQSAIPAHDVSDGIQYGFVRDACTCRDSVVLFPFP